MGTRMDAGRGHQHKADELASAMPENRQVWGEVGEENSQQGIKGARQLFLPLIMYAN